MFELSYLHSRKISDQRIQAMYKEAAENAAARHAVTGGSARRIANWLRSAATKIEGDAPNDAYQPQLNQLRTLAR